MMSQIRRYEFPVDEADPDMARLVSSGSSRTFYFNPYTGDLSSQFQPASKACRGGILADESELLCSFVIASVSPY